MEERCEVIGFIIKKQQKGSFKLTFVKVRCFSLFSKLVLFISVDFLAAVAAAAAARASVPACEHVTAEQNCPGLTRVRGPSATFHLRC